MNEKSHQQANETREWSPVDALASAGRTLDRIGAQLQKEAHNIQQEAKRHAAEALAARVEATRQAESVWLALAKQMMAAVKQEQSRQDVLTAELTRARVQTLEQERPASGTGYGGTLGASPTPSQGPSNAVDGAASPPRVAAFDVQRHPNGEVWMNLDGTVYNLGTYQASMLTAALVTRVNEWRRDAALSPIRTPPQAVTAWQVGHNPIGEVLLTLNGVTYNLAQAHRLPAELWEKTYDRVLSSFAAQQGARTQP